ncbi:MAG: hypothetical protein WAK58_17395, partial [Trebonia sp.]
MSGADIRADHRDTDHQDTEPPDPPWRPRDERRGQFLRSISARTSLRTKLITAVLGLVILALAAISVASVVMLRQYVTTRQDSQLGAAFAQYASGSQVPPHAQPGYATNTPSNLVVALQRPGTQVIWSSASMAFNGLQQPLPQLPANSTWASNPNGVLLTV